MQSAPTPVSPFGILIKGMKENMETEVIELQEESLEQQEKISSLRLENYSSAN